MPKMKSAYEKIMIAASNGRGLKLSPDEVYDLARDDAIETTAVNFLLQEDFDNLIQKQHEHWKFWKKYGNKNDKNR